jgi:Dihydrodipicolinate synthase/N-acetylneuraminate lyase
MKKANFLTPVVTAFDKNGKLDIQANQRIWEKLIQNGISGLVIMGSTGEFFALNAEEKTTLIKEVTAYAKGRTPLYIGTNCAAVEETIELSNYALNAGANGVMVIGPYYFSLMQENVEFYYDTIADSIHGDIFLYNFPDRTGYDLTPEVTLRLLRKHKNIVGYKDTVGAMGHTRKLIQTIAKEFPDFTVLSGFDDFFAHNMLSGGNGCIGGLSNVYPELFAKWIHAVNTENLHEIARIQKIVDKLMALYDITPIFIPVLKAAMKIRGIAMEDVSKKPFISVNEAQLEKIQTILAEVDALIQE